MGALQWACKMFLKTKINIGVSLNPLGENSQWIACFKEKKTTVEPRCIELSKENEFQIAGSSR